MTTKTTRELVFETSTNLFLRGQKPSVPSVRTLIGQGSNTTIQDALNDWWKELSLKFGRLQSHPDVPDELGPLFSQLWLEAVKKADENLSEDRRQVVEQLRLEQERLIALSGEMDALSQANSGFQNQITDLTNKLQTASALQLAAREKSEQLRDECKSLQNTVEAERKLSEESRVTHQAAMDKLVNNLEETQRKMLLEVDAARQEVAKTRAEAKLEREVLQVKLDKATRDVMSMDELKRENSRISANLDQANREKAHLIDQITLLGKHHGRKPTVRRGGKAFHSQK